MTTPTRSGQGTKTLFTLNTGDQIPGIGLGTWQSEPHEVRAAVKDAIQAGYRHIDTAWAYENEKEVGQGIKDSGIPRSELWITTKLDNRWHKRVAECLESSLENLQCEYLDLWLMHWPCSTLPDDMSKAETDWDFRDTWREMQKVLGTGKVKNIGVSNFDQENLEKLFASPDFKIMPAVNQIELHPMHPSPKLKQYCESKGIHCTAYSCMGSTDSPLYKDETLLEMAKKKGKSPQQLMLQWGIRRGSSVIPKSVTKSRIEANFQIDNWELTSEEFDKISSLKGRIKVCDDEWLPEGVKVFFGNDE